jgi:hypothetical protein
MIPLRRLCEGTDPLAKGGGAQESVFIILQDSSTASPPKYPEPHRRDADNDAGHNLRNADAAEHLLLLYVARLGDDNIKIGQRLERCSHATGSWTDTLSDTRLRFEYGVDDFTVMSIFGHSSTRMLERSRQVGKKGRHPKLAEGGRGMVDGRRLELPTSALRTWKKRRTK